MINSHFLRLLFTYTVVLLSYKSFAQLSKTHYIPPLTESGENSSEPDDQYIYISTPTNTNVRFKIKPIGLGVAGEITGTVSSTTPFIYDIGFGRDTQLFVNVNETSTIKTDKGFIIEAESPVYASVRINAGAQAGALVSKGLSALETNFRIGTFTSDNPGDNYLNFISVMATEDNTSVSFSDLPTGLIIENYSGPIPININLNEGESYIVAINAEDNLPLGLMDGLIGGLVSSDKDIIVNCGSANGSFDNGNGRDYGIDQIAGLSKIGNEYIFVRGDGPDAWENVLVVAHTDNTTIRINGNAPITTINAGEYYVIEGNNYSTNDNMHVETSQDVFMYQGVGSNSEANQGMFFVPPLSCETRGNIDNIANIDNIGSTIYTGGVSIVTRVGATVTINNQPLGNFSTVGPNSVAGNPDYETYKITGLSGNISVQGDDELYVAYFNVSGAATSGSFYSGFPANPEISFDAQFAALGNCIPNVTLEAANASNFDTFEWFFDDGSGFQPIPGSLDVVSITPTIPGRYKLIGTITCTGETLESVEVPISICPDDIDNDGIIDNLDIDNDNDGILNCTESLGDVIMDLSDTRDPRLQFQDGTVNTTIATDNITLNRINSGTNSVRLTSSGNIISDIPADSNAENDYSITFTEPVNVKFSEDISNTHNSVDGEFFIAKILPVNKNITLVDPDDRLLVDSNFDGIFETGVTQISGSEIHFRINPNPNGATPYNFYANQVDGFSFIHNIINTTSTSSFQANLSLTCFKKDNDNDGIKDELDLDSDNDGIPDFIENQGTLTPLSGIDNDLNGLDDIFNINDTPIDTDSDGITDFYDLDSDNDGIYDINEADPAFGNLSDTDSNGIDDGPVFGTNGWTDNAETTPDSNIINYTVDDTDTDGIFSYLDLDSDGDLCSDVTEAGFTDDDDDDLLGISPITRNSNGLVTNASDGYTIPNPDYLNRAPITITSQPVNTTVCESSNEVLNIVSPEAETFQWELSTDNGTTWSALSNDATYSGTNTSDLTISDIPLTFNNYQYRVKLDRTGNTCGLYSDEITLTVDELPIANTAAPMRQCDDDNDGEMLFDLTLQDNAINTVAGFSITYHTSLLDAQAGTGAITTILSGNRPIWARVENNANTDCFAISSFNLEVYESPTPLDPLNIDAIRECDDSSVGNDTDGLKLFDLTRRENDILNGQPDAEFSLTYFTDASYDPATEISNPVMYPNTNRQETIFVRITNNTFTDCFTDTSFNIEVFELPLANIPSTYSQCDDETNDRMAFFNLTLDWIKEEINPNYASEGLTFTYYNDQIKAETIGGTPLTDETNYFVDLTGITSETVWVRATNPNGCFRAVPLTLEINPSSVALDNFTPQLLFECDETGPAIRSNIATFDLSDTRDAILNIFAGFSVTVHFYENQNNAEREIGEIANISNPTYQNITFPSQNIWVRVRSNLGNDCLGLKELVNLLNVEALPTANPVTFTRQCDHDTSDTLINYPFDTTSLEADILNGQNPANVTITYFDENGNSLPSPLPNRFLTETQTITVIVTNNNTQDPDGPCDDITTIDFTVDEQPIIAANIPPQIVCDGDAGDIDADDGLFSFDTSFFTSTILGSQNNMEVYFTYIDENGVTVTNEAADFPNSLISANQTIIVSVENPVNNTCIATTTIDLVVNPLPEFILDEEILICGTPFTPTDVIPILTNPSETFIYEWTFQDGTIVGNNLILPSTNITQPGAYTLALTNPITLCKKELTVSIKAATPPNITEENIKVNDFQDNNTVSIIDTTILGNGTYVFSLVDENNNVVFPYQESPIFNNVKAGIYTLFVRDIEAVCSEVGIAITVLGYPKFFTPNGDDVNDIWQIKGIRAVTQANATIRIYNRYGKLIKQISAGSDGWDGTFNGRLMPTDDYWFNVRLEDGRTFMGHFTLKR